MTEQTLANIKSLYALSCTKCGSGNIRRSPRKVWERALEPLIILKAYRCQACQKRFVRKA